MGLSADDKLRLERIENAFTRKVPQGERAVLYERMRANANALAQLFIEACPEGHERLTALTKLEESIIWANASLARDES
ncbi:MAG TPA: hypothetical protein VKB77_15995 [Terriglobales bacterium]|nr:hypothetical protein [Terriglobales bacterium]